MLVRLGFYRGRVQASRADEFYAIAFDELLPAIRAFPECIEASMMRPTEADQGAPDCALVLTMRYPDAAACATALASPQRLVARSIVSRMLEMFEGDVFHYMFDEDRIG